MFVRLLRYWALARDLMMFALLLAAPVQAQQSTVTPAATPATSPDAHMAERQQRMVEDRARMWSVSLFR